MGYLGLYGNPWDMGAKFHALFAVMITISPVHAQTVEEFDAVSYLSELNVDGFADHYPWISEDGLRLYYTKEISFMSNRLYFTSRLAVDSPFDPPVPMLPTIEGTQTACWLDSTELDLWFMAGDSLMHATRPALSEPFGEPVEVTLTGYGSVWTSPTLTQDEEELFLTEPYEIQKFVRTGPETYLYSGPVELEPDWLGPAKLSLDGLHLYYSAEVDGVKRPWQMTRSVLGAEFTDPRYYSGPVFTSGFSWGVPQVSSNGLRMVLSRTSGSWQTADLLFVSSEPIGMNEAQVSGMHIHPNPADALCVLSFGTSDGSISDVRIQDAEGRVVFVEHEVHRKSIITRLDGWPSGLYLVSLTNETGALVRSKLVVTH